MARRRDGAARATEKDVDNTVKIGETIIEAIAQRTSVDADRIASVLDVVRTHSDT